MRTVESEVLTPPDQDGRPVVLFGRSRFLAKLGAAMAGAATAAVLRSQPAYAQHEGTPYPCGGYPKCHYCDGSLCTSYCSWPSGHSHCQSGGQYWETCTSAGNLYRCRDWHEEFPGLTQHHCICSASIGRCR